jgi:hypothetical protein
MTIFLVLILKTSARANSMKPLMMMMIMIMMMTVMLTRKGSTRLGMNLEFYYGVSEVPQRYLEVYKYISFPLISPAHEFIFPQKRHRSSCYNERKEYGSDIDSDDNTYQYHENAHEFDESSYDCSGHSSKKGGSHQVYTRNSCSSDSKILGGQNVLHSLSNATCLEL